MIIYLLYMCLLDLRLPEDDLRRSKHVVECWWIVCESVGLYFNTSAFVGIIY